MKISSYSNIQRLNQFLCLLVAASFVLPPQFVFATSSRPSANVVKNNKSEIQQEGVFLEKALFGEVSSHPLDTFRVLAQQASDLPGRVVDLKGVTVTVLDESGKVVSELNQLQQDSFTNQGSYKYYIALNHGGREFTRFLFPIKSVAFQNNKVIFVEDIDGQKLEGAKSFNLQFIDLKAFRPAIGQTAMPVFRLPLRTNSESYEFKALSKQSLQVSGQIIAAPAFDGFSESQQVAFNMSVSLVDIEKLEQSEPLFEDIQNYFGRAVDLAGKNLLQGTAKSVDVETSFAILSQKYQKDFRDQQQARSSVADAKRVADRLKQDFLQQRQSEIDQISKDVVESRANQRSLLSRVKILKAKLAGPQPLGAAKLAKAMAFVSAGIKKDRRFNLSQAVRHFLGSKSGKMGLAVASGLSLGTLYPEQASAFVYGSLDTTRTIFEIVFGKAKDLGVLGDEARKATFIGFTPQAIYDAYLNPEKLPKFMVGMTALFTALYCIIGVPHIMTNSYQLAKDLKSRMGSLVSKEKNKWKKLKQAFIERQRRLQEDYTQALSDDSQLGENHNFTAEDDAKVEALLAELKKNEQRSFIGRWLQKVSERKQNKSQEIETFGQALRHFFFSYATFTISGTAYNAFWNSFFAFRSFVWHPIISAVSLNYPKSFGLAVSGRLPAEYNGGRRSDLEYLRLVIFDRAKLSALKKVEDELVQVETALSEKVLQQTYSALSRFSKDSSEIKALYDKANGSPINSKNLNNLNLRQRAFFRTYYEKAMQQAMAEYFKSQGIDGSLKNQPAQKISELNITKLNDVEVQSLIERANLTDVYEQSAKVAASPLGLASIKQRVMGGIVTKLNPKSNMQTNRIQTVNRQAKKPQAMARAVRDMIAKNVVDKPLELLFTFACLAGITEGILMPIQEQMHSENSWFYLSRMVFSSGFLYGVLAGVFADVWMKLQQDEQNEGSFESVPEGEDADGSFLNYYRKQTLNNPQNGYWKNQKHYWKIVIANWKAAFTTMALVGLATLGRLDLDAYIAGYLFVFLSPLTGWAFKLEQGFELSTGYFAKDIPEEYRSHPKVQEHLNSVIGRKRLKFNLFYKTYENIVGNLLFTFQQMTTSQFGSRSFSRIIFGGYTPTEITVKGLDSLGKVPGLSGVTNACAEFLSNNYTDFDKYTPKK